MQFIVGTLQMLLVLSLQVTSVSAVGLRHFHHAPHHDSKRPIHGVSLMQGKVDMSKANATDEIGQTAFKNHAWATTAVNSAATTANVLAVKLHKEKLNEVLKMAFAAFLVVIALCVALGAIALFYDVTAHCLHRARFRQCQAKVQRAHDAFSSKSGELPLCPYCVEPLSCKRGPNKVVFICGHRFHVECSNRWFSEHPDLSTHCPICRDVEPIVEHCKGKERDKAHEGCGCAAKVPNHEPCSEDVAGPSVDGAFAFILESLNRSYPEIITKDCVERWLTCNTETWLTELSCPRYNSILRKSTK